MRFMTASQKRILDRLVRIAGGSTLLVEQAFQELSRQGQNASLDDVVEYILANREEWHRSRAQEDYDRQADTHDEPAMI